ncbi:VWA domain-containing protein [Thiomicrospira microaerophila]|uniref:VWA domain-containing protein n=1 Tax=Thiomicrospira microaerophila TaxID=406020 RepID=UPI0005CB3CA7|nr:VWA domain-containing protein [Thiomicrospira microaerophila]
MLGSLSSLPIKAKLLPIQMHCSIEIKLQGLMVICQLTQSFTNTSDEVVEAIHAIPIPIESTLTGFKAIKNNQAWLGKVMPKDQADRRYEEVIEEGNSAFQLKRKDDLISLVMGNLLSKETLSVELSLIFPIQFIAGAGQLYFPLVIGSRYGQSNLLAEFEPNDSFLAQYPISVTLDIEDIASSDMTIHSPSHPLSQITPSIYRAQGQMDSDLKILFDNLPLIEPTFTLTGFDEHNYLGLLSMMLPNPSQTNAEPKDILFLLDCSGSMSGAPMQQLKESVSAMLSQMRPQDRFNLYPFGSSVQPMFDRLQTATREHLMQAKQKVRRQLDANLGGTETVSAMLTALMGYQTTRPTDLILITDGEVWLDEYDIKTKLLKAYANQHNIRFFTVGVGHAACEKTVKYLAEISNGSYVLTNPHEDIRFQMQAQFKRLFQTQVRVSLSNTTLWHQIPTAYQGDAICVPVWLQKS